MKLEQRVKKLESARAGKAQVFGVYISDPVKNPDNVVMIEGSPDDHMDYETFKTRHPDAVLFKVVHQ